MATENLQTTNEIQETQTVEYLKQKYKWDWNDKLNSSPFRIEIKKLKANSKQNPSMKQSNNEFKRILKTKEKELLSEFQKKCDQAKTWINDAHNEHNNNEPMTQHNNNEQIAAYKLKKEKIETINKFWDELICKQTVFLQQKKIQTQKQQMDALEKQTKQLQKQLDAINNMKKNKNNKNNIENNNNNNKNNKNYKKNKKNKKKKEKEYQGLIGYFNKPKKHKNNKINNAKNDDFKKEIMNEKPPKTNEKPPKTNEKPPKTNEKPPKTNENIIKTDNKNKNKTKKINKNKGSMKGGFLKPENIKGLYSDKKLDSELSVNERNVKNLKQIEEMGLKDAVNNPLFTWEKPKEGGIVENDNKQNDPLTAYLNQQYEKGQTQQTKD